VRSETRAKAGMRATGIITAVKANGIADVRFDDGSIESDVAVSGLTPLEKTVHDSTGLSYSSNYNSFDFTKSSLPTGVEAVGDGVELVPGRGNETHLRARKGTFLRVPFKGLRHEKLRTGAPIP